MATKKRKAKPESLHLPISQGRCEQTYKNLERSAAALKGTTSTNLAVAVIWLGIFFPKNHFSPFFFKHTDSTRLKYLNRFFFFAFCKSFLLTAYVTRTARLAPVQPRALMEACCYIYIPNHDERNNLTRRTFCCKLVFKSGRCENMHFEEWNWWSRFSRILPDFMYLNLLLHYWFQV